MPKIVDPALEWEADHSGVIHLRKYRSETEFMPGYGTKDFGVSPFEPKRKKIMSKILLSGLMAGGLYMIKRRSGLLTLALLWRESLRKVS